MDICLHQGEFQKCDNKAPILMISLMGPKHGRILHAYIGNDRNLVINCSERYSFERRDTAPFELFYRYLLSTPCTGVVGSD
ncbi:hypothetical protein VTN77DRAFT_7629 [Rasamsonia byssochlamydoides]|uniref:uncharacterized protein n=1 Tax=Rasamsonia byssochlamydoides TaxID=89139 RepID=UPI003742EE58